MKKTVLALASCIALVTVAAPPNPYKAAARQHKAEVQMMHQQQKHKMQMMQQHQKHQAQMMHRQHKIEAHMMRDHAKAMRARGRAAMRGPRFSNGHHVPPPNFHGWRRGPRPHAHYRNVWMDDIWYDAFGYPCYSPYYMEVVEVPGTVVYTPGAVVAPPPVVAPAPVVVPQPTVVAPAPVVTPAPVVVPQPTVVAPAPTTVVVPPPRTRAGAIVDALLAP